MVELDSGDELAARAVVLATGAGYRQLPVDGCERLNGAGVFYAATLVEARMCGTESVAVVGGGNSAGQAAIFLSGTTERVSLLLRGGDLRRGMSSYLVDQIEAIENIDVLLYTEVRDLHGNDGAGGPDGRGEPQPASGASSPPPASSSSSAPTPAPSGSTAPSPRTTTASCSPATTSRSPTSTRPTCSAAAPPCRWRPASPASSRSATAAPARSSGSPRPSARARCPSASSTSTSRCRRRRPSRDTRRTLRPQEGPKVRRAFVHTRLSRRRPRRGSCGRGLRSGR